MPSVYHSTWRLVKTYQRRLHWAFRYFLNHCLSIVITGMFQSGSWRIQVSRMAGWQNGHGQQTSWQHCPPSSDHHLGYTYGPTYAVSGSTVNDNYQSAGYLTGQMAGGKVKVKVGKLDSQPSNYNPRASMAYDSAKGLLNPIGENNCFLNSAIQVNVPDCYLVHKSGSFIILACCFAKFLWGFLI